MVNTSGVGLFQYESGSLSETKVESIYFNSAGGTNSLALGCVGNYNNPSLHLTKNFVVTNASETAGYTVNVYPRGSLSETNYRISNFQIDGNVYVGQAGYRYASILYFGTAGDKTGSNKGPLSKFKIGGDIYLYSDSHSESGKVQNNYIHFNVGVQESATSMAYDINNADATITGAIHLVGSGRTYMNPMLNTNGKARSVVFSVGGFDGRFSFLLNNGTPTDYVKGSVYNQFVLVFTNAEGKTYTHVTDTIAESGGNDFDEYSTMRIAMNGAGTQYLKSGTLKFKGGIQMEQGTLLVNGRAAGANDTTYTHGELEMNAGTFGIYNNSNGAGTFTFTDCYWKSGTLVLGTYESTVDTLSFSGAFQKGSGEISDVVFDFDGDGVALLSQQKIIACTDFSEFTADSFKSENKTILGELYKAVFQIKDDGLYVQYVAVPEPSTIAAFFGLAAFALATIRRRK